MADVRINAKTATTTIAADDYFVLDGADNGTRAILGTVVPAAYNLGTASDASFSTLAGTAATATLTLGAATETVVLATTAAGAGTLLPKTGVLTIPHATGTLTLGVATEVGSLAVNANGALTITPKAGQFAIISSETGLAITAAAETSRILSFQTASVARWNLYANATAEAGANAGSNLILEAIQDGGGSGGAALTIVRSTLASTFGGRITATATGAHTFGTTNVVTMTAGALSATASLACTAATAALTLGAATETLAVAVDAAGKGTITPKTTLTIAGKLAQKAITTAVAAAATPGALGSANIVRITSDLATKGVILQTGVAGDIVYILNGSSTAANLFPASGGTINGGAGDAGCAIPASKGAIAICHAANTWICHDLTALCGAVAT